MTKEAGNSRTVRVFLSSTFRDFMEERDLLVRKVFPELRRRCRQRQVELIEVDLRWGITEQEAQQGKVLPICLAEIDRARPFFMGLLGERYGWVPEKNQYDLSLIVEQPWLEEHRGGKSVTELEILHGVLNNPAMKNRAFFYLRDPRWAEKRGGAYLGEGPTEKAKLAELKAQIRQSGFPVVENYPNPEILAKRVQQDLWMLIDEAYPESEVPDALALDRRRHEAYGATRMGLYLGGDRYFEALDRAIRLEPFVPVLVTGQSGGGKSALLANWVARYCQLKPETAVIVHHLGSGADAADPVKMVVRLMQEIARITGDELKLENDPEKQLDQLPIRLAMAGAWAERTKREMLLILDGLDKVSDRKNLIWFPSILPAGIKVAASCLDGEILKAIQGRLGWEELKVKPFSNEEQAAFIRQYLGRYRKSLTPEQFKALQSFPLSGNPLFLLTVLEELRVFGVHEKLEERLRILLSPPPSKNPGEEPTVDDVFEHVLARLEKDLGQQAVQKALEAIWASRSGLYQEELLALAGLAPVQWAEIRNALDESLYESSGKINFGHDYVRKAVEDRYGLKGKRRLALHERIAQWFRQREVDDRVAEELPWQWRQAKNNKELRKCLLQKDIFERLHEKDAYELLSYWLQTERNVERELETAWKEWLKKLNPSEAANLSVKVGSFLRKAGFYGPFTEKIHSLAANRYFGKHHGTAKDRVKVFLQYGSLLRLKAKYKQAGLWLRKALALADSQNDHNYQLKAEIQSELAALLHRKGKLSDAELLKRKALTQIESVLGKSHPVYFKKMIDLGAFLLSVGKSKEAESFIFVAQKELERLYGAHHPDVLLSFRILGDSFSDKGMNDKATACYKIAAEGLEVTLGPFHPNTLNTINNYALLLDSCDQLTLATTFYKKALHGKEASLGKHHPDTLRTVRNLGLVFLKLQDSSNAYRFLKRSFEGYKDLFGLQHEATVGLMADLGRFFIYEKNLKDAEVFLTKAWRFSNRLKQRSVSEQLSLLSHLGILKAAQNDPKNAMSYYLKVFTILKKLKGMQHPETLMVLNNLGALARKLGDLNSAEVYLSRALKGYKALYDKANPDFLRTASNLARTYLNGKKYLKSRVLTEEVFLGTKELYGFDHSLTTTAIKRLSFTMCKLKQFDEARDLLKQCSRQSESCHNSLRIEFARVECSSGNYNTAKEILFEYLKSNPDAKEMIVTDASFKIIRDTLMAF
jgi:Tfp pilus assembly protein PilF